MRLLRITNILTLLLFACVFRANGQDQTKNPVNMLTVGSPAPRLSIARWIKGAPISEFKKGQVYVVEFWATWCLPCIAGMPHLSELARKYKKDITVLGVSILERPATTMSVIEEFVAKQGDKMDYIVAAESDKLMAQNWLSAFGIRGIPTAFVIDKQGRVAWIGLPANLGKVLPLVISDKWDVIKAAADRKESQRLTDIDNNLVVNTLNPTMGNPGKPELSLKKIEGLLAENPGLKYYYKTAHFTIWSLVKLNSEKVVEYYHEMKTATDDPPFKSVTDAVTGRPNLKRQIYLIAADAYQEQLNRYPWSMDFADTYKKMAELYQSAGDEQKSKAYLKKADETSKIK